MTKSQNICPESASVLDGSDTIPDELVRIENLLSNLSS